MSEVPPQGRVEGWQEDPYGRHELRFFDGQQWTPYVRDGDANGIDEPGGPMVDTASSGVRSPLLDLDVLVVERADVRRRWSERAVHRPDGTRAGTLRRASHARAQQGIRSLVVRDHVKKEVVELVDEREALVLTLIRPVAADKTSVEVRDSEGRDAGRIGQQSLRRNETRYVLLGPSGHLLGDLQTDNWHAGELRVVDSDSHQVATITRDLAEPDPDLGSFSRPDDYIVRITGPVHESLRTLVVACALSLDAAVRPGARMG